MHKGFVLSLLRFAIAVHVVTEMAEKNVLSDLLCVDDVDVVSVTIE